MLSSAQDAARGEKDRGDWLFQRFRNIWVQQRGFTLAELLVTILIISILAVAAHGYFLQQRRKGWMAQVVAATKHLASVQEFWVNTAGSSGYTMSLNNLVQSGFNFAPDDVVPTIVAADSDQFCLEVVSQHDPTIVWHYNSSEGFPKQGGAGPSCAAGIEVASLTPAGSAPIVATGTGGTSVSDSDAISVNGTSFGSTSSNSETTGSASSTSNGSGNGNSDNGSSGNGSDDSRDDGDSENGSGDGQNGGSDSSRGNNNGNGAGTASDQDECADDGSGDGGGLHPSGKSRDEENGNSGDQGKSGSDPDGDHNGGDDKAGGTGGQDTGDQDGNNGGGNDDDFEDDNKKKDDPTQGETGCNESDEEPVTIPW